MCYSLEVEKELKKLTKRFKAEALLKDEVVTDEPPQEVLERGHDRCPIFLKEDFISEWLSPQGKNKDYIYQMLRHKEEVYYLNAWAA